MSGKKNTNPEKYAKRRAAVEASTSMQEAGRRVGIAGDMLRKWFADRGEDARAWLQDGPVRGPSGDHHNAPPAQVGNGLELKAQTIKVNADGTLNHRYDKSHTARNAPEFDTVPAGHHVTKTTTRIDADGRVGMQYVTAKPEEVERWNLMLAAARATCEEFRGAAGVTPIGVDLPAEADDLMNVFALGDPHIGALADADETGTDNDLKIATRDNDMFLDHMVEIAPFAGLAYLLLIGDNSHADDNKQVTPGHGHKVDVDSRAHKIFRTGVSLWSRAVQRLLRTHARVVVDIRRGNHDPITAFFLAETLRAMFANDDRVEVLDNVREHNYYLFGKVLLATTHGHRTKPEGLAEIMLTDVPELALQATAERHWITGHVHSKAWFDFRSCSLETLRTIFPGDEWARASGYRSFRGSVVITYHKLDGEVMRQAIGLDRARRAAGVAA